MMLKRRWWMVLVGLLVAACPRGEEESKEPGASPQGTQADTARANRGGQVFGQQCASCHGVGGTGDGPASQSLNPKPRDLTQATAYKFGADREGVEKTIRNGIPGSAMPAFGGVLSDDQIEAVSDFVITLQKK